MGSDDAAVVKMCHVMLVIPCHITAIISIIATMMANDVPGHTRKVPSCDRTASYVSSHMALNPLVKQCLYYFGDMTGTATSMTQNVGFATSV